MISYDNLFMNRHQVIDLSARGLSGEVAEQARSNAEKHLANAQTTSLMSSPEPVFALKQPAIGHALGDVARFQEVVVPEQLVSLKELGDVTNKTRSELLGVLQTGERVLPVGATVTGDRVYHLPEVVARFEELKLETSALKPSAIKALSGLKTKAPAGLVPHAGSLTALEGAATIGPRAISAGSVATATAAIDLPTAVAAATAHLDEVAETMATSQSPHTASTALAVAEQVDHSPIPVLRAEASTLTKAMSKVRHTPLLALAYAAPLAGVLLANTASSAVDAPQPVRVTTDVIGAGGGAALGWKIAKMAGGAGRPAAAALALLGGASGLGAALSWKTEA